MESGIKGPMSVLGIWCLAFRLHGLAKLRAHGSEFGALGLECWLFWVRSRVQVSESKVWVQDPEFGSGVWCLSTDDHCVRCNAKMNRQVNGVEAG